jgi:glycosyltransferase involved in cell wall biosynthesis
MTVNLLPRSSLGHTNRTRCPRVAKRDATGTNGSTSTRKPIVYTTTLAMPGAAAAVSLRSTPAAAGRWKTAMDHPGAHADACPRRRRAWVVDPSLAVSTGHHPMVASAVTEEAARRDLDPLILAGRNIDPELWLPAPARPVFSHGVYDSISDDPCAAELENFVTINRTFADELTVALADEVGPDDLLIFPLLRQNHLLGLADFLERLPRPLPAVLVAFKLDPGRSPAHLTGTPAGRTELAEQAYAVAFRRLFDVHPRGIRFLAETPKLLDEYRRLGAWSAEVCHLISPHSRFDVEPREHKGHVRVAYVGVARENKGFHLLPDIVRVVRAARPDCDLAIQACIDIDSPTLDRARDELAALAADDPCVQVFDGVFDREAYFDFLNDADIVLQPYDRSEYGGHGSGVFREVVSLGKPVVTAAETECGAIVEAEGIGVTFVGFDAPSIAEAVITAVSDYDRLSATAMAARRRLTPAGIGPVLDRILVGRPAAVRSRSAAVSVLLTVADDAPRVRECVESVLAQRSVDLELCIADGGSVDGTADILARFTDPRVRVVRGERRQADTGHLDFNRLIGMATAAVVAIAEVSDLWAPDKLARQLEAFEATPELDVCYHNARFLDGNGQVVTTAFEGDPDPIGPADFFAGNPIPMGTVMFRRDLIQVIGLQQPGLLHDYRFWMKAALTGALFEGLAQTLVDRRPGRRPVPWDQMAAESLPMIERTRSQCTIDEIFPELGCCSDLPRSLAYAHFELGHRFFTNGQVALAAADFEQAVRAVPSDPAALNNLGVCLVALGARGEGARLIRRAVDQGCEPALANVAAPGPVGGPVRVALTPWDGPVPQLARLRGRGLGRARTRAPAAGTLIPVADDAELAQVAQVFERVSRGDPIALPVLVVTDSAGSTGRVVSAYDAVGVPDPPPGHPPPVELLQIRSDEWPGVIAAHLLCATEVIVPSGGPDAAKLGALVRSSPCVLEPVTPGS